MRISNFGKINSEKKTKKSLKASAATENKISIEIKHTLHSNVNILLEYIIFYYILYAYKFEVI
jgi:hypothetical protein